MKKLSALALPVCFLLVPCCYILVWTVTEVYYYKKKIPAVVEEKREIPAPPKEAKNEAFKVTGKRTSAANLLNLPLNNFEHSGRGRYNYLYHQE
ncbi:MAG: hypothetical protein M3N14_07740 [Bacteroidota bacterium]|nr:hypothetical protein [Bacteroidota bacterium]